jgi:hypothetical protein
VQLRDPGLRLEIGDGMDVLMGGDGMGFDFRGRGEAWTLLFTSADLMSDFSDSAASVEILQSGSESSGPKIGDFRR